MCKIGLGAYFFAKTNIKRWFSDFSDFPQMENRDFGWTGLDLGSPKTLFSAKKPLFLGHFLPFPIIWGFPLGPPIGPYWPLWNSRYTAHWPLLVL